MHGATSPCHGWGSNVAACHALLCSLSDLCVVTSGGESVAVRECGQECDTAQG
jgi:hypothetical protein